MPSIEQVIASITEDQRSDRLWSDKDAARVLSMHPNKIGSWWNPNEQKLVKLAIAMPGETSAMLLRILATALRERERMGLD